MSEVGAGMFGMGARVNSGASFEADELPVHPVTLTRGFLVGETEVTIAQYCEFFNQRPTWIQVVPAADDGTSNACYAVAQRVGDAVPLVWLTVGGQDITNAAGNWQAVENSRTNHPMVNVTWYGAALYCNFLSEQEGRAPLYQTGSWTCDWSRIGCTNTGYHLPTEAQWEYAASGWARDESFPWGRFMLYEKCNIFKSRAGVDYNARSLYPCTTEVRAYPANDYGLYDVIGNVAEWCDDWYDPAYYTNGAATDPVGARPQPTLLGATNKAIRGGGWDYSPSKRASLSGRAKWHARTGAQDIGFRVVREWSGDTNTAPSMPLHLFALTNELGRLILVWMPPLSGNHEGYLLQVSGVTTAAFPAAATSWDMPGVRPGAHYVFELTATNALGVSASNRYEVTAYAAAPASPQNARVLQNSPTNLTLGWEPPLFANQDGYFITRDEILKTNLAAVVTQWTDYAVAAEASYNYKIYAANHLGTSTPAVLTVTISNQLTRLAVTPSSLDFGGLLTELSFAISNAGVGNLHWTNSVEYENGSDWMAANPTSGDGNGSVTVAVSRSSLAAGCYTGRVIVASCGGIETVTVTLAVTPVMTVAPSALDFGYSSESLTLMVSNPGLPGVHWTNFSSTADGGNWLSSAPAVGTDSGIVTVTVDRAQVADGFYTGAVVFLSSHNSATVNVYMSRAQMDWWVDGVASPSGDGKTPSSPLADLQTALDLMPADIGATVHLRGGAGRLYTHAIRIDKSHVHLVSWDESPVFSNTAAIADRIVAIAASQVTLSNLTFAINVNGLGAGDSVIELTDVGHNTVIDGCDIHMANGPGGEWNQGAAIDLGSNSTTNVVIRRCHIHDYWRDTYRPTLISGGANVSYVRLEANVFSNTAVVGSGPNDALNHTIVVSNRFLNTRPIDSNYGIFRAGYRQMMNGEFSYNIIWNNDGHKPVFLAHIDSGGFDGSRVFNNTFIHAQALAHNVDAVADAWLNVVFLNNLMVSTASSLINGGAGGFNTNSGIGYNLWYGADSSLATNLGAGVMIGTNYAADPLLVNTSDLAQANFLQPYDSLCPFATNGYGHVNNAYPTYIGAIPPHLAPTVQILAPRDRALYVEHEWIEFAGLGRDAANSLLTNLAWRSDRDGPFGNGAANPCSTLSAGLHTVTLYAVDALSATGRAQQSLALLADSNTNGLPDDYETRYWPSAQSGGGTNDFDGDGPNNYLEWFTGTDPTNETSYFTIMGVNSIQSSNQLLSWPATTTRQYTVQETPWLDTPFQVATSGLQPPVDGPFTYTNSVPPDAPMLFHRIRVDR